MRNLYLSLLLFFCFLISFRSVAQNTYGIIGTVKDAKGEPVPGATVFLTNTQYKTVTDNSGKLTITAIAPGTYQMVIKMIGFAPYVQQINVNEKLAPLAIQLKEDNILLNTVTIKTTDPNRPGYLKQFVKYFIGEGPNAERCKIVNPQVLNFHYDKTSQILEANATDMLAIENDGLGYRINYVLTEFKIDPKNKTFSYVGYSYFEELTGTAAQQKRWKNNRQDAYLGSSIHFFRSIYDGTAELSGFSIYSRNAQTHRYERAVADSLFLRTNDNMRLFRQTGTIKDTLYVFYKGQSQPKEFNTSGLALYTDINFGVEGQLSGLQPLSNHIEIDKNGDLSPSKSFFVTGYWAWQKMSELLPLDYRINQTIIPAVKDNAPDIAKAPEKVYLHLDRNYYTTGDTLWFKAYVVDGVNHQLSNISNVLNVELIDAKDSVRQRIKLLLKNGMSQGDFDLPFTLTSGNYRIRAYTNWMRNFGDDYFFNTTIALVNPFVNVQNKTVNTKPVKLVIDSKTAIQEPDIQFFPEGGEIGADIPSKIAFKAMDANGRAITVKGIITDEQNRVVTNFAGNHLGMGTFILFPEAGKSYKAQIKMPDSSVKIVSLPKVATDGYVLNALQIDSEHIRVSGQRINAGMQPNEQMTLIARSGGIIYYEGKSKPGANSFVSTITKTKFPTGIVQFALLSSSGEPLNERLMFIQNNDQLKLGVAAQPSYPPRQKVKVQLSAKNASDGPMYGNFSVSVTDENKLPLKETNSNTILTNLLLTSDLKGYIEDPAHYFSSLDKQTADDLDALMLTQGYRKFVWKQDTAITYKPENGLAISGNLKTYHGKPIPSGKVLLFASGEYPFTLDTLADKKGRFVFNNLFFTDSTRFMLQGATEKERNNLEISLDKSNWPIVKSEIIARLALDSTNKDVRQFIEASNTKYNLREKYHLNDKSNLLKEVTIKEKPKHEVPYSDNLGGPGFADYFLTADDIAGLGCAFIANCLDGKIPGVGVAGAGAFSFPYLTKIAAMNRGKPVPMTIIIDGVVNDMGGLNTLAASNISSIEFLTTVARTAIYGGKYGSGIVIVTTKRGADAVDLKTPSPGTITFMAKGFYKAREFYSPQYDIAVTNKELADQRTTIYWNPFVISDKEGKASFEYFNAGNKGTYRIVIEGIDGEGRLGHAEYTYKVD